MTELVQISAADDYDSARGLFVEYAASLPGDVCLQGFREEVAGLAEMYGPPGGCLVVARAGGAAVGCVGVRALSTAVCEMKRLYVRDAARGQGLGRRLAVAAVEAGRRLGYERIVLDTLDGMTAARRLYLSLGFQETAPYRGCATPGVRYMSLALRGGTGER